MHGGDMTAEKDSDPAKNWIEVRDAERTHLESLGLRKGERPIGLALSGGGIRAATFSLGLLQGLAEAKLLAKFHYLSTVSGGGYIGSWLSALIRRRADGKVQDIEPVLAPPEGAPATPREDSAIRFLRRYSNYLTPQVGIMSVDTWTAIVTYSRNLFINLSVLLCVAVTLILGVHFCIALGAEYLNPPKAILTALALERPAFWLGFVAMLIAALGIGLNLGKYRCFDQPSSQKAVLWGIVLPTFVAASCWAFHFGELANVEHNASTLSLVTFFACIDGVLWLVVGFASRASKRTKRGRARAALVASRNLDQEDGKFNALYLCGFSLIGGAAGGAVVAGYMSLMANDGALGAFIASGKVTAWLATVSASSDAPAPAIALPYLISAFHLAVGTLVMLWAFATAIMVVIGLAKRRMSESDREWLARLGGWLYVIGLLWCVIFAIVAVGPGLVLWISANFPILAKSGAVLWALQTAAALLVGNKALSTGGKVKRPWLGKLLSFAPYIFILGVMFIVAYGVDRALINANNPLFAKTVDDYCKIVESDGATTTQLTRTVSSKPATATSGSGETTTVETVRSQSKPKVAPNCEALNRTIALPLAGVAPERGTAFWFLLVFVAAATITALLSWRVDVNLLSFQQFYRNRLARCYLGASRFRAPAAEANSTSAPPPDHGRNANMFTDLAAEDDLYLASLRNQRPFHIFNTALNMTAPGELGWQERKASSFTLTPLHCGFSLPDAKNQRGYRPTERYARGGTSVDTAALPQSGPTVSMAMSTSGAAASSSMGHNSTSALALLLTVFNVRLGRWVGNPAAQKGTPWKERSPWWGLKYLMYELFGTINISDKFVYLSDGGHFENLGVYELVRRRCALIVVSSCGQDGAYVFDDLSNAIRMCSIDFGVTIDIDPAAIKPNDKGVSEQQYAIGRIRYSALNEDLDDGYLIYIKPAITARTSVDILQYRSVNTDFPQQSTVDQWYTESQFESHRKLGQETAKEIFAVGEPAHDLITRLAT